MKECNGNNTLERQDPIVTDDKFDLILESLHTLAVELENDFHKESESKSILLSSNVEPFQIE